MPDTSTLSILDTTKKALGIPSNYTEFDMDITMHINSVFSILTQIAVGPEAGFAIQDNTETWAHFIAPDPRLNMVQTFMYMKVRLMFDPPVTSFGIESFSKQVDELLWRLNIQADPWPASVIGPPDDDDDDNGEPNWGDGLDQKIEDAVAAYMAEHPVADGIIHEQVVPIATWSFSHTLGRIPVVAVYVNDDWILADTEATETHVTITFPSPTSGVAVLT